MSEIWSDAGDGEQGRGRMLMRRAGCQREEREDSGGALRGAGGVAVGEGRARMVVCGRLGDSYGRRTRREGEVAAWGVASDGVVYIAHSIIWG